MRNRIFAAAVLALQALYASAELKDVQFEKCCVSLAGGWNFALGDVANCTDTITLPTTTDMAKKGDGRIDGRNVEKIAPERDDAAVTSKLTRHLTRRFPYIGKATYEREIEIPSVWKGRRIEIFLERTKKLDAYLDGVHFAHSDTLAAPARLHMAISNR